MVEFHLAIFFLIFPFVLNQMALPVVLL